MPLIWGQPGPPPFFPAQPTQGTLQLQEPFPTCSPRGGSAGFVDLVRGTSRSCHLAGPWCLGAGRHKLSAEMGTLRLRGRWRSCGQNRSASLQNCTAVAFFVRCSGPSTLLLPQSLQATFPANSSLSWPGRIPRWLSGKESACQCQRHRFDPWVGKIHWRREWQPTPVFLPGESPGQRKPGRLQSMGWQTVRHDQARPLAHTHPGQVLTLGTLISRVEEQEDPRPSRGRTGAATVPMQGPRGPGPGAYSTGKHPAPASSCPQSTWHSLPATAWPGFRGPGGLCVHGRSGRCPHGAGHSALPSTHTTAPTFRACTFLSSRLSMSPATFSTSF